MSQLRERGNALYKRGQLTEAIKAYQEAARRAEPDDYLPWSNLSAAYYEGGDLPESIQSALRALAICQRHDQANGTKTSAAAEQKLVPRMIRAYMHTHNFNAARQWLDRLSGSTGQGPLPIDANEMRQYRQALDHAETLWRAIPDVNVYRSHLLAELPRYRPSLRRSGQQTSKNPTLDEVTDLVDFAVHSNIERNLSVFLGGIGDARHFYAQLAILGVTERMVAHSASSPSRRKYQFTLNDTNSAAVCRSLVLSALLDDLACLADLPQAERTEIYAVVYYTFAGVIIPRYALDRLFRTVDVLVDRLRNGEPVLPWLHIYDTDRVELIRALEAWKNWNVIEQQHPTSEVIGKTVQALYDATASRKGSTYGCDERAVPSGCRKEFETYFKAPFLQAPRCVMRDHEPELLRLLETDAPTEKLLSYVTEHWCVNPTLLDEDWRIQEPNVFGNPFNVCRALYNAVSVQERGGPRKTKLFDYASSFFQMAVVALRRIRSRLSAEYILGDVAKAIDGIRYGLVEGRDTAAPGVFDLVHLSNAASSIPTVVNASKILNDSQTARLLISARRFDFLKNSPEQSHSDCLSAGDKEILFKTSQMQVTGKKGQLLSTSSSILELRRDRLAPFPYEHLLSRSELTRFMFTQFFKLAVPVPSNSSSNAPSVSNLTNFFDLLIHLHDIGYPSHWLADVLAKILDNFSASASLSPPRTPDEPTPRRISSTTTLKSAYSGSNISSVTPFIPEMSTLTTIFQRLLPFNAITPGLPLASSIYQYTVNFNNKPLSFPAKESETLLLIIYNNMHAYTSTAAAAGITLPFPDEENCIIISTFTYTHVDDNASAKFWMREDVMNQLQTQHASSWHSTILRAASSTDSANADESESESECENENNWMSCFEEPVQMDSTLVVVKGERWMDAAAAAASSSSGNYDDDDCNDGMMELDD